MEKLLTAGGGGQGGISKVCAVDKDDSSASSAVVQQLQLNLISWQTRCESLQRRLEKVTTAHIDELSEVAVDNRRLRQEADASHALLASLTSRANQFEQKLVEARAQILDSKAGSLEQALRFKEAAAQTVWVSSVTPSTCPKCPLLQRQVTDLLGRLATAAETMQKFHQL